MKPIEKQRGIIPSAYIGLRAHGAWSDAYAYHYLAVVAKRRLGADDTQLFKEFQDNESFKRWLANAVLSATYSKSA